MSGVRGQGGERAAMLRAVSALSEVLATGTWWVSEEKTLDAALALLMRKVASR